MGSRAEWVKVNQGRFTGPAGGCQRAVLVLAGRRSMSHCRPTRTAQRRVVGGWVTGLTARYPQKKKEERKREEDWIRGAAQRRRCRPGTYWTNCFSPYSGPGIHFPMTNGPAGRAGVSRRGPLWGYAGTAAACNNFL